MCHEFSNFLYFSIFSILFFFVVYLQKSRSSFSGISSSQSHWMILMSIEPPCPCNSLLPLPLIPPLQGVGPYCTCPLHASSFCIVTTAQSHGTDVTVNTAPPFLHLLNWMQTVFASIPLPIHVKLIFLSIEHPPLPLYSPCPPAPQLTPRVSGTLLPLPNCMQVV